MTIAEPLPDFLTMPGSDLKLLAEEYLTIVRRGIDGHERSQQRAIGPSEVGHPCSRRIGYKLLDHDENAGDPNWKATVGTALHTWLEAAFAADNAQHYEPEATRWILEATLICGTIGGQLLTGHCDLYDQVTFTVLDHKTVGPTQLKKYKAKGPGDQYRAQAHIYGRGWQLQGRRVDNVAVMFLPRNGELREAHFWTEPYDEQIARDAIGRADGIAALATAMGDDALPLLPTANAYCTFCPYYLRGSTDLTQGCPGDPSATPTRSHDRIEDLV